MTNKGIYMRFKDREVTSNYSFIASAINRERVPMIIPIVTNVNRPNTIFMAGVAICFLRFFWISDQKEQISNSISERRL